MPLANMHLVYKHASLNKLAALISPSNSCVFSSLSHFLLHLSPRRERVPVAVPTVRRSKGPRGVEAGLFGGFGRQRAPVFPRPFSTAVVAG